MPGVGSMRWSSPRTYALPVGVVLGLWVAVVCLASLPHSVGTRAWAQSGGDRWVTLATREIDAKVGRTSIDLSRAKGAFKAIRVS